MKIVLDTHIVVHAAFGLLSQARRSILENADNNIYVSQISAWEITKLVQHKKLEFKEGLEGFFSRLYTHPRYTMVGLEPKILCKNLEISEMMHKDPADQIIVATTTVLMAQIMTNDSEIQALKWIECL